MQVLDYHFGDQIGCYIMDCEMANKDRQFVSSNELQTSCINYGKADYDSTSQLCYWIVTHLFRNTT